MRAYIAPYVESFLPLFVAINPMGIIPIYLSVTENLPAADRRRLTLQAMLTGRASLPHDLEPQAHRRGPQARASLTLS